MSTPHLPEPRPAHLSARERAVVAAELLAFGHIVRGRALTLRATGHRSVELAVVELAELATAVFHLAHRYQYEKGESQP